MRCLHIAALFILILWTFGNGQTPSSIQPPRISSTARKEIDPELLQRRSVALTTLQSLAVEARSYRDEALRARIQARVADVLWEEDKVEARNLFRRAWEAAEAVESKNTDNSGSTLRRLPQNSSNQLRTNLRSEILKIIARRDSALGEELLAKLSSPNSNEVRHPESLSETEIAERLRLGNEFLEAGEVGQALQFADSALLQATRGAVEFLIALRDKNPLLADQRFMVVLSNAAFNPQSDANTVSLLTSYAFTPSTFLIVSNTGQPSSIYSIARPAPALSPNVRSAFFKTAANILLRPFAQLDQTSAGRAGTYFIATRLLPLFQQFAPELAPAINAQLAAIGSQGPRTTARVANLNQASNLGIEQNGRAETIDEQLNERLQRAQDSDTRDWAYAYAATRVAEDGDPRARDYVDKIWDLETRAGVRRFVDFSIIRYLLGHKQVEEALALMRKSELSHILRAHFLTKAGGIVGDTDRGRAMQFLDEAVNEARQIEASTPERAYSLIAITSGFSKFEKTRAWQLLGEAVKATNAVPQLTGEDGHTTEEIQGKFGIRIGTELATANELSDLFGTLAESDFYQALDAAQTFLGDSPRATALISVGRTILDEKPRKSSIAQ